MSRLLFPKISTYSQQWLRVSDNHQLYIEQSGNPDGIPVVYFHGGPGAGSNEYNRRYFDPEKYRIVTFDQRGCGRSKPSPSLIDNTTEHLVNDVEIIRQHLGITKWLVTGGSWGTTLALVYGIKHPENILSFILRGIFLGSQAENDWLYCENGAAKFFPEHYQEFIQQLPLKERDNVLPNYYKLLTAKNEIAAIAASKAWYLWELRLSSIEHYQVTNEHIEDTHQAHCMALISSHFFTNKCFIDDDYILNNIDRIQHIPAIILHGRYDMVCQLHAANQLVSNWEAAQLQVLPKAGHSGFEKQTVDAFCKATDNMANFLSQ